MLKNFFNKIGFTLKRIREFYKRSSRLLRFVKYFVSVIILLLILTAAAAEYTSRPSFCPTCHYMEPFYQSWRTSAHNRIDCVECHFEPGISGTVRGKLNGLVQIVNYISLSYKKRKPWAEIPDNTCNRAGCHETQAFKDTTYNFKGVYFSHKHHLEDFRRGKKLKCTSCHSQIVQGTHMQVTEATCFTCHFKKSDDPEHKYDKLSNCTTCHDWTKVPKDQMANFRYDHTPVVENNISCYSCHTNTVVGNGNVEKERCFQCHFENSRLEKFKDIDFMHKTHISKHSMPCYNCHSPIQHKVQKIDPNSPPDCISCHASAHSPQVSLFTGENGFNVERTPSVMFLNGINCKGCHIFHETDVKGVETYKAGEKSCEKCHGKGYDNLIIQWQKATEIRITMIAAIYKNVLFQVNNSSGPRKQESQALMDQAFHNIRIVETGKSVHNVLFAEKLLLASYDLMKKALTVIGSSAKLPEFKSSSEFIPNECFNCHSGIQEIAIKKFDMNFSHNQHIVKSRISCNKCHSNQNKHGELIVNKQNCNSCHHSQVNSNEDCENCHKFQMQVFNGSYLNKSQPDYMKSGGVGCIDCHSDQVKIIKPDNGICMKCHDNSYKEMSIDWKKDVKKLVSDAELLLKEAPVSELNDEQKTELNETKKIINDIKSYPSIYVHNYDLISSILSEKVKFLKKLK